ncbi:MAG: hypothetical protein ACM3S2_09230 [Ignavibacteriales bacterium]
MEERSAEDVTRSFLCSELEYVKKRIRELSDKSICRRNDSYMYTELEFLYKKEAFYILQLARLKGILKPTIN